MCTFLTSEVLKSVFNSILLTRPKNRSLNSSLGNTKVLFNKYSNISVFKAVFTYVIISSHNNSVKYYHLHLKNIKFSKVKKHGHAHTPELAVTPQASVL